MIAPLISQEGITIPSVIVSLIAIILILLVIFEVFSLIEHRREAYERAQERKELYDYWKAKAIAEVERELKKYLRMVDESRRGR